MVSYVFVYMHLLKNHHPFSFPRIYDAFYDEHDILQLRFVLNHLLDQTQELPELLDSYHDTINKRDESCHTRILSISTAISPDAI